MIFLKSKSRSKQTPTPEPPTPGYLQRQKTLGTENLNHSNQTYRPPPSDDGPRPGFWDVATGQPMPAPPPQHEPPSQPPPPNHGPHPNQQQAVAQATQLPYPVPPQTHYTVIYTMQSSQPFHPVPNSFIPPNNAYASQQHPQYQTGHIEQMSPDPRYSQPASHNTVAPPPPRQDTVSTWYDAEPSTANGSFPQGGSSVQPHPLDTMNLQQQPQQPQGSMPQWNSNHAPSQYSVQSPSSAVGHPLDYGLPPLDSQQSNEGPQFYDALEEIHTHSTGSSSSGYPPQMNQFSAEPHQYPSYGNDGFDHNHASYDDMPGSWNTTWGEGWDR